VIQAAITRPSDKPTVNYSVASFGIRFTLTILPPPFPPSHYPHHLQRQNSDYSSDNVLRSFEQNTGLILCYCCQTVGWWEIDAWHVLHRKLSFRLSTKQNQQLNVIYNDTVFNIFFLGLRIFVSAQVLEFRVRVGLSGVRIPTGARYFLLQIFQTITAAHLSSYSMGTGRRGVVVGCFPAGTAEALC
jgi:hypothetical protein